MRNEKAENGERREISDSSTGGQGGYFAFFFFKVIGIVEWPPSDSKINTLIVKMMHRGASLRSDTFMIC